MRYNIYSEGDKTSRRNFNKVVIFMAATTFEQILDLVGTHAFTNSSAYGLINNYVFSVGMGRIGSRVLPQITIKAIAGTKEGENFYPTEFSEGELKTALRKLCITNTITNLPKVGVFNEILVFDSCFVEIEEIIEER